MKGFKEFQKIKGKFSCLTDVSLFHMNQIGKAFLNSLIYLQAIDFQIKFLQIWTQSEMTINQIKSEIIKLNNKSVTLNELFH